MHLTRLSLLVLLVGMTGCAPTDAEAPTTPPAPVFAELVTPAAPGSGEPNLHVGPAGEVLLSWIEPGGAGDHALRFARLDDGAWSAPQTVAQGSSWFVNWADFPSVVALDDGALAAHFLRYSNPEIPYAYDVWITRSADGGATWSPPVRPHDDGTSTEHGFVSLLSEGQGRLFAAWLDGRRTGGGHDAHGGAMTLRTATLMPDGSLHDPAERDDRVCDCCQTDAVRLPNGLLIAYRNRSPGEVRDISVIRRVDGQWEAPRRVHADGWTIQGCPVNGPAVDARGPNVALAWFTGADDVPRVRMSFSRDEGATFAPPITVDDGSPLGRVDVVMLPSGAALVSWIEQTEDGAQIRLRRIHPDGTREASIVAAVTSTARTSGFPRLALRGDSAYLAWTQPGEPTTVHTAVARVPGS